MSKADYSKILFQAYDQFLLPLGGEKVPTPYRKNEYGSYQKLAPEFQGKSSPKTILEVTLKLAKEQHFDLEKSSIEEIREFMVSNKLGIDCSGFVYRMLDYSVQKLGMGNLIKAAGVEHVGRTNVAKLTSDEFSIPIAHFTNSQAGDIIRLNSSGDILHGVVVLDNQDGKIIYAHSSSSTNPPGVHKGEIIKGKLPQDLKVFSFHPESGDGVRRLKALI